VTTPEMIERPTRVLVVDDANSVRTALSRFLSHQGFSVNTAASGEEALDRLREGGYALMLLDIRMPGMSGVDVVPEALDLDPELAILMLSAMADATSAAVCMQRGAVDYLTKPIELNDLSEAIRRALRRRDTMMQNREISTWLKEEVQRRTEEVRQARQQQFKLTVATLEALVNALEGKNSWLRGHSARVAAFAATIAHHLKLPDDAVEDVRLAGRLHDLGKIGIRESVLNKTGRLTKEEFDHVKQHVLIGSQILSPLEQLGAVVPFVRSHHEHWDGSGYPDGIAGNAIPLGARIICAAEVYDALTTSRPYQEKLAPDEATDRMKLLAGKVIDPTVMAGIESAIKNRKALVFLEEEQAPGDT